MTESIHNEGAGADPETGPASARGPGGGGRVLPIALALGVVVIVVAGVFVWSPRGDGGGGEPGGRRGGNPVAPTKSVGTAADSHARMLATLRSIAAGMDQHPYLGRAPAEKIEADLAALTDSAPAGRRCELEFAAGDAALRLGDLRGAILHLTKAHELIAAAGLAPDIADYVRFKLGVAWLRLGETENCCAQNRPESCIVPIRGDGVHTKLEGSTNAVRFFEEVLRSGAAVPHRVAAGTANSSDSIDTRLAARWLLNLAYMTLGRYPDGVPAEFLVPATAFRSAVEFPRFTNVARKLGLDTFNLCGGAIVDDFDNDGYLDVVASTWDPTGQLRYFRNKADGTFEDRTEAAGLTGLFGGLNLIQADYDNDGNLDFLVLRGAWLAAAGRHPNSLIHNNGDGTFTDVTFLAGLGEVHYPTQTGAFADYDNDGDVDLFVGNESSGEVPAPCQLFRNDGNGRFTDVAAQAGVQNFGFAKGSAWGDINGDGFPELYVSNYMGPNRLFGNKGDGTFIDVAPQLGVAEPIASFPTWFWDFDNDGALDLFVASYTGRVDKLAAHVLGQPADYEIAGLYRNDGKGGFTNVAKTHGLDYPMLPMGSNFGDLDNDGFLDFYLGTGDPDYHSLMPNLMFHSRGGQVFEDVTMAGGFGHLQKGHGIAFADLDNDGDLDVFEQMGGAFRGDQYGDALFENPGFGANWISLQLVGQKSNRSAIGVRIKVEIVEGGKTRSIYRHVGSGGSFGANPLRQTIGIGKAARIQRIEIDWPTSRQRLQFRDVSPNQFLRITEDGRAQRLPLKRLELGG